MKAIFIITIIKFSVDTATSTHEFCGEGRIFCQGEDLRGLIVGEDQLLAARLLVGRDVEE